MTLAVATQNPNAVAETYVRQHMRLIRPGETVGIALSGNDSDAPAYLPYHVVGQRAAGPMAKAGTLAALVRTGYSAAPSRREEVRLEAFLRQHEVEAIFAEFGTTGAALRKMCLRLGLPLLVNFHGHDATVLGQRADIRAAYRLLARDADKIICGSRHFASVLTGLGIPLDRIDVVPCGIELDEFQPDRARDPDLVVAVGRLTRKKRPDLAIRAFAVARQSRPSLRLRMIGDGDQKGLCEQTVRELGVGDAVFLAGAQSHSEVKESLARASVFIQHSVTAENGDQESQGISLLEAMASGVPTVVTDHNGFSETVVDGMTGFLSPEGDVDGMARGILRLAEDRDLSRSFGAAGRARVEEEFDAVSLSARLRGLVDDAVRVRTAARRAAE